MTFNASLTPHETVTRYAARSLLRRPTTTVRVALRMFGIRSCTGAFTELAQWGILAEGVGDLAARGAHGEIESQIGMVEQRRTRARGSDGRAGGAGTAVGCRRGEFPWLQANRILDRASTGMEGELRAIGRSEVFRYVARRHSCWDALGTCFGKPAALLEVLATVPFFGELAATPNVGLYKERCQGTARTWGVNRTGSSMLQARMPRASDPADSIQRLRARAWFGVGVAVALTSMPYTRPSRSMTRSTSSPPAVRQ